MRMLDLFCGGGLAGAGYWQSGCFAEIVGVDLDPSMKRVYPFDFICGDALALDYEFLDTFQFIHASPPCQFYSKVTPAWARDRHERLIPGCLLMLHATGLPFVVENVPGSGHDLRPNLVLSGNNVGLPLNRPRLFRVSEKVSSLSSSQINIEAASKISSSPATNLTSPRNFNVHDSSVSRDELIEAFGLRDLPGSHLRRLTKKHIEQGIPPAMTRLIASKLFPKVMIA